MSADTAPAICRDEDCPACGFPETYAEIDTGAIGCRKCGWRQPATRRAPVSPAMRRERHHIDVTLAREWLDGLEARIDAASDKRMHQIGELGAAQHHVAALLDVITDLQREQRS